MSPLIESLKRLYSNNKITIEKIEKLCEEHNFSIEEKEYILGGKE